MQILRPAMYGSQHSIVNLGSDSRAAEPYRGQKCVVVSAVRPFFCSMPLLSAARQAGHCCESGDLLTPAPGEPNVIEPQELSGPVRIRDLVCVDGAGAYCSSMSAKNYNSFPEAPEVLIRSGSHQIDLIRRFDLLVIAF